MSTTPFVYATSAALLFTEQELGGPCTEVESDVAVLQSTLTSICLGNGDRVGLVLMNVANNDAYISTNPLTTQPNGILISANGGAITLTVRDDFTLPARQWFAFAPAGLTQVHVLEIVRFKSNTGGQ
jgi:hypothetical protein